MYMPVVMTAQYRVIRKGNRYYEHLDEAKRAAMTMSLSNGQMSVVIDDNNLLYWQGHVKGRVKTSKRASKVSKVSSEES